MGQSSSTPSANYRSSPSRHDRDLTASSYGCPKGNSSNPIYSLSTECLGDEPFPSDYTFGLPDESLACIFQTLGSGVRKRCSIVCRRWLRVEGQSRHRISLNAQSDVVHAAPQIFARFESITKLALKCDRRSASIGDETLISISVRCRNLTHLKLRACRAITDDGMEAFSKNCRNLKKLSCGSCTFGARGVNAVVDNCTELEELSVKRLRGLLTEIPPSQLVWAPLAAF